MTDRDEGRTLRAIQAMAAHGRNDPMATLDAIKAAASEAIRAPTSDTEDVGEEEVEIVAKLVHRLECEMDAEPDEDPALYDEWWASTDCNRPLYRRFAKRLLARLRRTPEREIRCLMNAAYQTGVETPGDVRRALEVVDNWLATQDPNAGGEDG